MKPSPRSLLVLCVGLLLGASRASAQSGGFQPGDLVFSIGGPQAPFPDGGTGIARIDANSGQIQVLVDFPSGGTVTQGVAYDPFRDRVVFGGVPFAFAPAGLWATDAQGNLEFLFADNSNQRSLLTPASGGRVYHRANGIAFSPPFRYLDATNVERVLMDSTGASPYAPLWANQAGAMIYDAPSNALIVAISGGSNSICSGTDFNRVVIRKLPLSADGSRVSGPETCAQFQISAVGNQNIPVGIGSMNNGHVLVSVNPNASGALPVFLEVDPQSLSISQFASPGTQVNGIPMLAGIYSSVYGKGVCVDISTHVLRLYGAGQSGPGTILSTSSPISPAGNTPMSWTEVRPGQCGTNAVTSYCTAKTSSGGCLPAIGTSGGASLSAGAGFKILCKHVDPGMNGLLFYSSQGAASLPFNGGVLCVQPPAWRLAPQNSGGAAACSGSFSTDFNTWIADGQDAALVAGAQVWAQYWYRDTAGTFGTGLSNALTFHICP